MRSTLLAAALLTVAAPAVADDWPQWGGPQGDLIWREPGVAERLPEPNADGFLPRVWSVPIKEGYAGPAVANGRVYVTDRDARAGTERVLCLDAGTGEEIWKHEYPARYTISYPAGPRATPVIDSGRVYTLGAVGDFFCFDEKTGRVLWQKNFPKDYGTQLATWGHAASPLVDGDQLITLVGGADGALVVSFDKATGKELWRSLEDKDVGYCPPRIFEFGGRRQLIVWHPKAVSSLDPKTGEVIWEIPWLIQAGLTIPTPRKVDGDRLFLTSFYNGPKMIEVGRSDARVIWEGDSDSERADQTDKLHSIIPTPVVDDGYIYGVCSYGQVRCLSAATGERIWETYKATGEGRWWNTFIIPYEPREDVYFLANEQGDLIIAKLTPKGYEELDRAKLIEPTRKVNRRMTIWSHPAFADRSIFARNDKEIIRVDLSAKASR